MDAKIMRWAALAATLTLTLTACAGGAAPGSAADATSSSLSASAEPTASPTATYTVPDVTGDLLRDGVSELYDFGIPIITLGDAEQVAKGIGVDEVSDAEDLSTTSGDPEQQAIDEYVIYKTEPAAGTALESIDSIAVYLKVVLPPEAKGSVWQATCQDGDYEDLPKVYNLESVWKLVKDSGVEACEFQLQPGKTFKPTKAEAKAIQIGDDGNKNWRGDDNGFGRYTTILGYCAYFKPDDEDSSSAGYTPSVKAAAMLCPESPFIKDLDAWGNGKKFEDGIYEVGDDIAAGTYKTKHSASDCYWERTTPNGNIIANDFITYAAKGAVVTVRKGESFISKECGLWEKQ